MNYFKFSGISLLLLGVLGCSSKPPLSQINGKVMFKNKPVPAGWISFTPGVGKGQVRVFQIQDGVYDSSKEKNSGLAPGEYQIRIAGFDGKKIPFFGQGKQIFNPIEDKFTVPDGPNIVKDWEIPASAGENVRIERTADS